MRDVSILAFNGKSPRIHPTAFIAPGCRIIGDVEIGEGASIWYNCVIRADVNRIRIGARTNIQDGSVIHCDGARAGAPGGSPTMIGSDVLVGHMTLLHGCILEDRAFIGLGAIVMDGCRIESDAMLGAGSLLTPGKRIGGGELWMGRPAGFVRRLGKEATEAMRSGTAHYVDNARLHKNQVTEQAA